jgi:hypothetical protein
MNADESKYRLEILKMARELLNEEYINRRAEDHNKWLAECDIAWKTRGIKLPYPPFAPYPSEAEILAKATSLYNFVEEKPKTTSPLVDIASAPSPWVTYLTPTPPVETPVSPPLVEPKPAPPVVSTEPAPTPDQPVDTAVDTEPMAAPSTEDRLVADLATAKSKPLFAPGATVKSLLPTWLQPKENNV